ncbi:MAG: hypothetical protein ACK4WK_03345 [Anaerolineae bacterium]
MTVRADVVLSTIAEELSVPEDELLKEALRAVVERQLRQIQAEIAVICRRYGVSGVEEMEARYRDGSLEEAGSWRDWQRLDHLEYKRDRLMRLLEDLG